MIAITMNRKKADGMYQKIYSKTSFLGISWRFFAFFVFWSRILHILFTVFIFLESMAVCFLDFIFYNNKSLFIFSFI